VQRTQGAVVAAHDEERNSGKIRNDVIAGLRNLGSVGHQLPAVCEHRATIPLVRLASHVAGGRQRECGLRSLRREIVPCRGLLHGRPDPRMLREYRASPFGRAMVARRVACGGAGTMDG